MTYYTVSLLLLLLFNKKLNAEAVHEKLEQPVIQ